MLTAPKVKLTNSVQLCMASIIGLLLVVMPVLKYLNLHSTYYDLGLYGNLLYNEDVIFSKLFYGHAQPFVLPLSYIYNLFSQNFAPISLIAIQSLTLLCAGRFIYKTGGYPALYAYLLFPVLWYVVLIDFHLEFLLVLFASIYYSLIKTEKYRLAIMLAILISAVKEIYSLYAIGLLIMLALKKVDTKSRILAVTAIVFIACIFYIEVVYFIPAQSGNEGYIGSSAFSWLGEGLIGKFIFITTNLSLVIDKVLSSDSFLLSLLVCAISAGFFVFKIEYIAPTAPVLFVYSLSNIENYAKFNSHYFAILIVPMALSFGYTFAKVSSNNIKYIAIACMASAHFIFGASPISYNFISNKYWGYGFSAYFPTRNNYEKYSILSDLLCGESDIWVEAQNSVNIGCIFNRKNVTTFPNSFSLGYSNARYPDIVVLDLSAPLFLYDKSCMFRFSNCTNKSIVKEFYAYREELNIDYDLIVNRKGLEIYQIKK